MDGELHIGHPAIAITLRRKRNAKRLTLRLAADGVYLTLPQRTPLKEAEAFARKQEPWLRSKLADRPERHVVAQMGTIPVFGEERHIASGTGRVARLDGDTLIVPAPEEKRLTKIKAFLKETARDQLTQASDKYSNRIGRSYGRISLRDTRSRWGSCTSTGNLMYSWRLVMAPPKVLDYVAAHEVAHLVEMNHSPQYWKIVEDICPDYKAHRAWLRQNGAGLHLIDLNG